MAEAAPLPSALKHSASSLGLGGGSGPRPPTEQPASEGRTEPSGGKEEESGAHSNQRVRVLRKRCFNMETNENTRVFCYLAVVGVICTAGARATVLSSCR